MQANEKPGTELTCKQFGREWQSLFATPCIRSGGITDTASVPINEVFIMYNGSTGDLRQSFITSTFFWE
jgi:hypothetical protein